MGIAYGANYGRPSLDLNFARNKSLIDTISGQNLVTFSRAQANYLTTYVGSDGLIKYASANEPRFNHNPITGECLGLLIEESRTNFVNKSVNLEDSSVWNYVNNSTAIVSSILSPDGISFARKVIPSSGINNVLYGTQIANTITQTCTFSCYAKAGEYKYITLGGKDNASSYNFVQFDLQKGTFGALSPGSTYNITSASIESVGNGWYRCSVFINRTSFTYHNLVIIPSNVEYVSGDASLNIIGDGSSGVYVWGVQYENGPFTTSYIPTTAAAVTRSADQASITGTNFSRWYNQSEGALFGQFIIPPFSTNTVNSPYVYKIGTSANLTGTGFYVANNTNQEGSLVYGAGIAHGDIVAGTRVKNAIGYTQSNGTASATVNGAAVSSGTSGTIPIPASDKIDIGNNNSDGRFYLNSTINRITYYPTRLQNFQLQQLTK